MFFRCRLTHFPRFRARREREGKTAPDWLSRKWAGSVEPTGSVATAATPTVSGFRFPVSEAGDEFQGAGTAASRRAPERRCSPVPMVQLEWVALFIRRFLSVLGPRFACRSALRRPSRCHLAGPACWDFRLAGVCAYNSGAGAFRYSEIRNCVSSKTAISDFNSENRLRTRLVNGERSPSGPACDRESREVHWDPGRPRSRSEVTEAETRQELARWPARRGTRSDPAQPLHPLLSPGAPPAPAPAFPPVSSSSSSLGTSASARPGLWGHLAYTLLF